MNGAILGMTKQEIAAKLDEIVDFSGCEKYLDTPVKRYSSGMMVRLGFAVAAHLDPEILVVDEVLAVGDAEFQKKAIGKMQDVSKGEGRTVLFVSHNMASVKSLCKSGVLLENGGVRFIGEVNECVRLYMNNNSSRCINSVTSCDQYRGDGPLREIEYVQIQMLNDVENMSTEESMEFEMIIKRNQKNISHCQFGVIIRDSADIYVGAMYSNPIDLLDSMYMKVRLSFPNHNLTKGQYYLDFNISNFDYQSKIRDYDVVYRSISFKIKYVDKNHKIPFIVWPSELGHSAFLGSSISIEHIEYK